MGSVDKDIKIAAMMMSSLAMTPDEELADFRRKRLGRSSTIELERLKLVRDVVRILASSLNSPDDSARWEKIIEAAKVFGLDEVLAESSQKTPEPVSSTDVASDEVRDESPSASAAPVALKVEEKHEDVAGALSPEMAAVGAVSVPNVMDLHGAPGLVSAPAPVSAAAAAVPPPRVTAPSISSAPGPSPWSGGGAVTPQPVARPVSPAPPAAPPDVVPESATAPPLSRPAGPPAASLSAMPGQLSTAPSPAGAAAFGARESGVPVDQTATGVKPTPEQRLRVSQPLPFSSNPGGAAKAPSAEPMPAQRTAPVDLGQTTAGVFDSVQALPFATAKSAASAGDEAIADDPSDQDLGAGLPFGRAKTQGSGDEPPAQPQVPAQPPPPPRRPAASAPAAVDVETARMAAFTIEQYAEVWVMMAAYPNHVVELRTRYGLADEAAHEALNAHFQQRFSSDPAQRASFTAACDQVKQRLKP